MSLLMLPNQAIGARVNNNNNCGGNYLLPCQRGDKYSLQGYSYDVNGADMASGQFLDTLWTHGASGWSNPGSSSLRYNGTGTGFSNATSPALGLVAGRAYLLHINVLVNNAGDTTNTEGVQVKINGELITLPNGITAQNTTFTMFAFYVPTAITTDTVQITYNNKTIDFTVNGLYLLEKSYPVIEAYNTGDVLAGTITPDFVKWFTGDEPDGIDFPLRFETRFALDALSDGCYYLKIKDSVGYFFTSEGISLKTSQPDTLLLTATNNDGAFGFDYSEGLIHSIRIKAKRDVTSYPEEAETYTYSDNSETLLFGRTQVEHTIFITDAPDYVHACLRHLRLHDTFMIAGVEYVRSGAYELNRRKTSALKQAVFTVREKEGVGSNYRLL